MIPTQKLLPPLPAKDREAFNKLTANYDAGLALIVAYSGDGRKARKRELHEKLNTAQGAELLKIGTELQTLDESFLQARRGAKNQMRAMKTQYVELFTRLIDRAEAHADKLIEQARKSYELHFAAFDAQPVGQSPVVDSLLRWKAQLGLRRHGLSFYGNKHGMPARPTEILPYPVETKTATEEML